MSNNFHIIIPARYEASRLPGKLLMPIGSMSVLERVYRQAQKSNPLSLRVAADCEKIVSHVHDFGGEALLTATTHVSGTDRIAEAAKYLGLKEDDIVVNVQGDEPFIDPVLISQVADLLANSNDCQIATLCSTIQNEEEIKNPNTVKVVCDKKGNALYFSRSAIPFNKNSINTNILPESSSILLYRHIGLYAYRVGFLFKFVKLGAPLLEQYEGLEQLRALWFGYRIKVGEAKNVKVGQDINTMQDLEAAREYIIS